MNVLESLNVLRHLTTKRALYDIILIDHLRDRRQLLIAERVRAAIWIDARLRENGGRNLWADPMDVLQ
jgi:hypothetical protein